MLVFWSSFVPQILFAIDVTNNNAAGLTIRIRARDIYPPAQITDLEAAPSSIDEGQVLLMWTAPDEDNLPQPSNDPVKEYYVRYATFSVTDLGGNTTTWWNQAADIVGEPFPPQNRGKPESFVATGLEPGTTIYFSVRSRDEMINVSLIDTPTANGFQSSALVLDLAPPVITGLAINASSTTLTLSWTASTAADVNAYRIYWDTIAPADIFTATVTVPAGTTTYTFNNLTGQNTYFFYVTAMDKGLPSFLGNVLESTPSAIVSEFPKETLPVAPVNFIAASITTNTIVWQWQDTTVNEDTFRIYASTGGIVGEVTFAPGSGSLVTFTETNLIPNVSYSRYVLAYNLAGESLSSNTTARYTLSNPPTESVLSNVLFSSMTISWNGNNNSTNTLFEVQYTLDPTFASYSIQSTTNYLANVQGLSSNATYYLRVRSQNGEGIVSAFDSTLSTATLPTRILGLVAIPGDQQVSLDWLDSTDTGFAGYFVYRTTNLASGFVKYTTASITPSNYLDAGLTNGVTYYYKVTSVNTSGTESPFSDIVFGRARKPFSARPLEPVGISGSLTPDNRFALKWDAVTKDKVGSTRVELAEYRIFKSTTAAEGPFFLRDRISPSTASWISLDLIPPTVWYLVRAADISDNESDDSASIETVAAPSLTLSSPDKTVHIVFSAEDAKLLNAGVGGLTENVRLAIERKTAEETGNVLTSYEIRSFGAISGAEIKNLKFPRPTIRISMRYAPGISGAPLPITTTLRRFVGPARNVGIFWHNTVEFVKLGGIVTEPKGIVSIKTARPLGRYQARQVLRATEFTLTQLTPRKIFTPNADGVNDEIILYMENPQESIVSQAKIFDITGAEVGDFKQGIVAGDQGLISLSWDGKDKEGNYVRSGIYVYQIQSEGKVINGTMVVAR